MHISYYSSLNVFFKIFFLQIYAYFSINLDYRFAKLQQYLQTIYFAILRHCLNRATLFKQGCCLSCLGQPVWCSWQISGMDKISASLVCLYPVCKWEQVYVWGQHGSRGWLKLLWCNLDIFTRIQLVQRKRFLPHWIVHGLLAAVMLYSAKVLSNKFHGFNCQQGSPGI